MFEKLRVKGKNARQDVFSLTHGSDTGKTASYIDRKINSPQNHHTAALSNGEKQTTFLLSSALGENAITFG